MAEAERRGTIARLFKMLASDSVPVNARKSIYNGMAIDFDDHTVYLSVDHVGPTAYEFHVSGRDKYIHRPRRPIDKSDIVPLFASHYGLSDVQVERIFQPGPNGRSDEKCVAGSRLPKAS